MEAPGLGDILCSLQIAIYPLGKKCLAINLQRLRESRGVKMQITPATNFLPHPSPIYPPQLASVHHKTGKRTAQFNNLPTQVEHLWTSKAHCEVLPEWTAPH